MPYEDVFITEALNFLLADAFEASEEEDVLTWLGDGKTVADLLGARVSDAFYTSERRQEIRQFVHLFGLTTLQYYLNDSDDISAIVLKTNHARLFVFVAGDPAGQPTFTTEWFQGNRAVYLDRVS